MSASVSRVPRFALRCAGAVGEDWDVFAGVICCWIHGIGIAAVVGGDYQQVIGTHRLEERAKEGVELFQGFCETFYVFAVAVEHVEIH